MLYLREFALPGEGSELTFLSRDVENKRTCYGSRYPFGFFLGKGVPRLTFDPITIFCGGNGSGKTTLLNLIGETLELQRSAPFNRSSFYSQYSSILSAERNESQQACKACLSTACFVFSSEQYIS